MLIFFCLNQSTFPPRKEKKVEHVEQKLKCKAGEEKDHWWELKVLGPGKLAGAKSAEAAPALIFLRGGNGQVFEGDGLNLPLIKVKYLPLK